MFYNWKDVRNDVIFGFFFGALWAIMAVMAAYWLPSVESSMHRMMMLMFGSAAILMFQLECWFTGVAIHTHGWTQKACSVVGSNVACATPFIVAIMLI